MCEQDNVHTWLRKRMARRPIWMPGNIISKTERDALERMTHLSKSKLKDKNVRR